MGRDGSIVYVCRPSFLSFLLFLPSFPFCVYFTRLLCLSFRGGEGEAAPFFLCIRNILKPLIHFFNFISFHLPFPACMCFCVMGESTLLRGNRKSCGPRFGCACCARERDGCGSRFALSLCVCLNGREQSRRERIVKTYDAYGLACVVCVAG